MELVAPMNARCGSCHPELQRFGEVIAADRFSTVQIRNGSRHFLNAVVAAGAERQAPDRGLEQARCPQDRGRSDAPSTPVSAPRSCEGLPSRTARVAACAPTRRARARRPTVPRPPARRAYRAAAPAHPPSDPAGPVTARTAGRGTGRSGPACTGTRESDRLRNRKGRGSSRRRARSGRERSRFAPRGRW